MPETYGLDSPVSGLNLDEPVVVKSHDYSRTAWFYERSAFLYSAGQIAASKASQIKFMQSGENVLYLGVGAGEDALLAARKGVDLTCVDLSSSMISRFQRKLDSENLQANLIVGDALDHRNSEQYDVVCTNFFLNCFVETQMLSVMRHAAELVRPGGKLMIADVSPPLGNVVARQFNRVYLRAAMTGFWVMGLVPLHPNHDYSNYFDALDLELTENETFRLFRRGPILFQNWVASKIA